MLLERRRTDEKEAEKGPSDSGCHTACIFYLLSALFSTAFAGVKSIFQAISAHQQIAWNSFLDVTGLLLLVTICLVDISADMHVHSVHWEMPCMN